MTPRALLAAIAAVITCYLLALWGLFQGRA